MPFRLRDDTAADLESVQTKLEIAKSRTLPCCRSAAALRLRPGSLGGWYWVRPPGLTGVCEAAGYDQHALGPGQGQERPRP